MIDSYLLKNIERGVYEWAETLSREVGASPGNSPELRKAVRHLRDAVGIMSGVWFQMERDALEFYPGYWRDWDGGL